MVTEAQIIANRRNAQKSTGLHMQKVLEIRSIAMFLCASVPLWLPVNYPKQSQFAGHSNERNLLFQQSIMKMNGFADAVKNKPNQTQLQTPQMDIYSKLRCSGQIR